MSTYVAFLRAVKVGKRAYPMAELRAALGAAGIDEVVTHIQTGNVFFRTRMRSRDKVVAALEKAFARLVDWVGPTAPRGWYGWLSAAALAAFTCELGRRQLRLTAREKEDPAEALPEGWFPDGGPRHG